VGGEYRFRFDVVWSNIGYLLDGLGMTLLISLLSLLASIVVGLIVALGRRARTRWISLPAATYCELFRDTPVLVQLFWVYYVRGRRHRAFT
jgi:polar amino acid transport system permease protein